MRLNGTVGFDSLDIKHLFDASSLQYMVGPEVTLPIFAGGRLRSTLALREAQQQEAAITYRKTVLQAWHDVVNALVAHRLELNRRARLRAQADHARAALDLARARYKDGVSEFLNVLDAERSLLQVAAACDLEGGEGLPVLDCKGRRGKRTRDRRNRLPSIERVYRQEGMTHRQSMIRKSGYRFSEKIMLKQRDEIMIRSNRIMI